MNSPDLSRAYEVSIVEALTPHGWEGPKKDSAINSPLPEEWGFPLPGQGRTIEQTPGENVRMPLLALEASCK